MEKHEDNLDKLLKAELEKEAGEIMEEVSNKKYYQVVFMFSSVFFLVFSRQIARYHPRKKQKNIIKRNLQT